MTSERHLFSLALCSAKTIRRLFNVMAMFVLLLGAIEVQAQHTGMCTMDCANQDIRPSPDPNPQQGQVPITRGLPPNQRGKGTVPSPGVASGNATAVPGSSSYTYTVPMFSLSGRAEMDLNLTLYYNSHIWFPDSQGGMMLGWERDDPSLGFQLNFGFLEWNPSADGPGGILTTADGAKHPLSLDVMNMVPEPGPPPNNLWYACANQICLYDSNDSTYIQVSRPLGTYNGQVCQGPSNCAAKDVTVTYKNGTVAIYQSFAVATNDIYDEFVMRPYHIQDANGNYINITYANSTDLSISSITDSLGRTINFFYNSGQLSCVTDGASCTASGAHTYTFSWVSQAVNFNFTTSAQSLSGGNLSNVQSGFSIPVVSSVCRPNSTCVKFNYGDWGIVDDIQELSANSNIRYELSYDFPAASAGALSSNPGYTHQTEKINGETNVWTYAVTTDPTTGIITSAAITDPTGTITTTTFSNNGDWEDGLPTQVQLAVPPPACPTCQQPPPPQVMKTQNFTWTSDLSEAQSGITNGGTPTGVNPRPASITTTLDDNSQSEITFKYDNSARPIAAGAPQPFTGSGSVTDKVETDFGATAPGAVLREMVMAYTLTSNHILGLPTDIQVMNGAGKVVSHTTLAYDGSALQSVSPLPVGHDNVNYSASSTIPRGNLTSTTSYADPVGNTGGVTSTFTYDMLGNKVSGKVGCCTQAAWNYSVTTQYAYPDSVTIGPTGNQLTTSYTYDLSLGSLLSQTDTNNQKTTFTYDANGRLATSQTPDGVTVTNSYDDGGANPAVSTSTSANSLVTVHTVDFHGHPVSDQVLNGTSVVSTTSYGEDGVGRTTQVSNPTAPGATTLYTAYAYDGLGRVISTTPPEATTGAGQNSYTISYSGPTSLGTDPASQQRKQYVNGLGQVVRVDLPGPTGGSAGSGSATISGTEQTASVSSGGGATPGTGSVNIGGSENSTQVLTHAATAATGYVTINGSEQSKFIQGDRYCADYNENGDCVDWEFDPGYTAYDAGTISITVNGHSDSYSFGSADSTSTIASHLAQNINADGGAVVNASASGATVYLTSRSTGSSANYSLASSYSWDSADFSSSSFTPSNSGGALTGGTSNTYQTVYNTGTVKITVTQGSTNYSKTYTYGQSDSASTVATNLTSLMHNDTTFPVDASLSGTLINLTTRATGNATGYPLATTAVTTSQYFSSSAFTANPSGANLISGQNGVIPDSGTVTLTVKTAASNPYSQTVNYGVGSTAATLANSITLAFNGDSKSPVIANAASGSATITLTARETGASTNYSVTVSSATSQGAYFSQPSFSGTAASLTGGSDSAFSLSTPITVTYNSDPFGRVLQRSTGQQTQTYGYDGLGRVTSVATPETGGAPVAYSYTDFGAIYQETDPRVVPGTSNYFTTTYAYDPLNRLNTVTYNDNVTPKITYTYNPPNSANNTGGRLVTASNSAETKTYQYDVMGRITQCLDAIGGNQYTVSYGYGADGQITSITYPSQLKVTYGYDAIGRLTQLSTPTQNIFNINSNSYNAAGMPVTVPFGNGVTGSFSFNNQLQLASLQYGKVAPATPLLSLNYSYGGATNNGQIQAITDNVDSTRSTSYRYDPLGRLRSAQTVNLTPANSWQLAFDYDIYDNRLAEIPTGGTGSMPSSYVLVDPATNHIQGSGVAYDVDGNMVSDGFNNDVFDATDRLTSTSPVPGSGGNPSTFVYGPDGQLVNRNGTAYIYAAGQLVAEYPNGAAAGSPGLQYVSLGGSQVASISGSATSFNYPDHLSTRVVADSSGNAVRTYGHFPFGETWYETGTASDFKFTSYRRDINSGLDYANARFYSSLLGRFTSLDSVLGGNRYTYVGNDPINLVDPTGMDAQCTTNPFDTRPLPLCGPDQLGSAVGSASSNCGMSFGNDGSFSFSIGSNCGSFNVSVGITPISNGGFETGINGLPGGFTPGPSSLNCIPDMGSCDPPISSLANLGNAVHLSNPLEINNFGLGMTLAPRYCAFFGWNDPHINVYLECFLANLVNAGLTPPQVVVRERVTAPNPDNDAGIDHLGNTARVMSNPCTYVAFGAAAAAPGAAYAGTVFVIENAPTVIHAGISLLTRFGANPGKPHALGAAALAATNAAKGAGHFCDSIN